MGRKRWATASASTALLAMVITGGYGWTHADASSVTPNQPLVAPTPTVARAPDTPTTNNLTTVAPVRTMVMRGGVGLGCAPANVFAMSMTRPSNLAEPAVINMHSDVVVGPGKDGISPEMHGREVNKQVVPFNVGMGAADALALAYGDLVAYDNMPGNPTSSSTQLIDKAKTLYRAAHTAYTGKQYEDATQQAWASHDAGRAASFARQAEQQPTSVAGLAAPPALEDETTDDRALCALHRAYGMIGAAHEVQAEAGIDGPFFVNNASASYQQALSNYNAGQFAQAEARAESAAAAASAVLQLGRSDPASEKLPDVPAPPVSASTP